MADIPVWQQSEIGYAMQQLGLGKSAEYVAERLSMRAADRGMLNDHVPDVMASARRNLAAREVLSVAQPGTPIGDVFFDSANRPEIVGVRVVFTIVYPDGRSETVSVVVNAGPTATEERIIDAARDAWAAQTRGQQDRYRNGTLGAGGILSVVEGGLQGAVAGVL